VTPLLHFVMMDRQIKVTIPLSHLHTPGETATLLHVSRMTLWRWVKAGKITPVEIDHRNFFLAHDIAHLEGVTPCHGHKNEPG